MLRTFVVSCQSVNSALYKNQSELGVGVLSELLEMLPDINSFLNQVIEVLWNLRSESLFLENSQNFVSCNLFHLWNAFEISKMNTDLGGCHTFLSEFGDEIDDLLGGHGYPFWDSFAVR